MNYTKGQKRKGISKPAAGALQSPCTITEAVQIARGVAEDVLAEYNNRQSHLQIAISLQIEIMKDIMIRKGLITEEEFKDLYMKAAEEFEKMRQESFLQDMEEEHIDDTPKMEIKSNDIEVTTESAISEDDTGEAE